MAAENWAQTRFIARALYLWQGLELSWTQTINRCNRTVERRLNKIFDKEIQKAQGYHEFIEDIYKHLKEYTLRGGKRLASCSTWITYKGFSSKPSARIMKVYTAIELYRHSILVHDDLVDNDTHRRGGPSIHIKYGKTDSKLGNGVAVFAGDILYTLAIKELNESEFRPEQVRKGISILSKAYRDVNESQILDLLFEYKRPSVKEWYVMASKRAASLFEASILIGAIFSDASRQDTRLMERAAKQMGYCFDIQDDIIDTYSSKEEYGREPGGDIVKGKKPLHHVYTYERCNEKERFELSKRVGRPLSERQLQKFRRLITKTGALELAKDHSRDHAEEAKRLIQKTSMKDPEKRFFLSFIDYIKDSLEWYK